MSIEENKAIVRRLIEEFWNQKRTDLLDDLVAPDSTCPSAPFLPPGPEGFRQIGQMVFAAFPDFHMEIDRVVAAGDKVAAHYIESGTHSAEWFGVPATGKKITWTESSIFQIRDGKVIENRFETDMMTMMQQMGAIPGA